MFFRFGVAMVLVVAISLAGTALEAQILAVKREFIRQQYRIDVARQGMLQLRYEVQQAASPAILLPKLENGELLVVRPEGVKKDSPGRQAKRPAEVSGTRR